MLHGVFPLQKVLRKINVARKVHVKKSCNKECVKSSTDKLLPNRVQDMTESAEPIRVKCRTLMHEPTWKKSSTESELPSRIMPYTLNAEPIRTYERMETPLPIRAAKIEVW